MDEFFAGQRRILGITGDMTNMLMIGGGIATAGLIPTLAGLVGITMEAAGGTDELAASQKRATEAAGELATAIGTEAAFLRLSHSARMVEVKERLDSLKEEAEGRIGTIVKERDAIQEAEGRIMVARRNRMTLEKEIGKLSGSEALIARARLAGFQEREAESRASSAKSAREILKAERAQERTARKILQQERIAARLRKKAADDVKADFGEQMKLLEALRAKSKGVLDFAPKAGRSAAKRESAIKLIQEQSSAWTALQEAAASTLSGLNAASAGVVAGLEGIGEGATWIKEATVEMVEFDRVMQESMTRGQALLSATGQSFAQAAVDAVIFGASAEEAANAVANNLLRQAAVEAVMETARGLAMVAASIWPPNPLAAAAAQAHFTAAAGFAALGAVAGIGAAATGGVSRGAGASAGGGGSAPTDADLPRSQGESGGGQETIIINYNPRGQAVHTADQVGQAITEALDRYSRVRGRSRANLGQLQRRGT